MGGKVKVQYFDMHGRACHIRMALWYAGVDFEDCRLGGEEFKKKKMAGDFQWGSLPDVQLASGTKITQGQSVVRHIGIAFKGKMKEQLYPGKKNPEQSYEIDLMIEDHSDNLGTYYFLT